MDHPVALVSFLLAARRTSHFGFWRLQACSGAGFSQEAEQTKWLVLSDGCQMATVGVVKLMLSVGSPTATECLSSCS